MKNLHLPHDQLFLKDLSHFLRRKRLQAKLSQKRVSQHLGYSSAQFISNWERGATIIPLSITNKLARLYGFPPEEILDLILIHTVRIIQQEIVKD